MGTPTQEIMVIFDKNERLGIWLIGFDSVFLRAIFIPAVLALFLCSTLVYFPHGYVAIALRHRVVSSCRQDDEPKLGGAIESGGDPDYFRHEMKAEI
jgi:hypothetical protein